VPPDPRADAPATTSAPARTPAPLVAWDRIGRRMGITAAVAVGLALVGWLVTGLASGGPSLGSLGGWIGLAVAVMFVAEVVFVGGAAVRAMLRAGERGERLARGDVSLLPPQLTRRLHRRP
jgi:uncharacterized BrkB/YihY/UPF0761 family membrane protein